MSHFFNDRRRSLIISQGQEPSFIETVAPYPGNKGHMTGILLTIFPKDLTEGWEDRAWKYWMDDR